MSLSFILKGCRVVCCLVLFWRNQKGPAAWSMHEVGALLKTDEGILTQVKRGQSTIGKEAAIPIIIGEPTSLPGACRLQGEKWPSIASFFRHQCLGSWLPSLNSLYWKSNNRCILPTLFHQLTSAPKLGSYDSLIRQNSSICSCIPRSVRWSGQSGFLCQSKQSTTNTKCSKSAPSIFLCAGPNTLVGLSKQPEGASLNASKLVASLLPAYVELLEQLKGLGVPEVQIHEPILTVHKADKLQSNFEKIYAEFAKIGLAIDLVTYYDDIGSTFSWVTKLPVQVKLTSPSAGAGSQSIQTLGTEC